MPGPRPDDVPIVDVRRSGAAETEAQRRDRSADERDQRAARADEAADGRDREVLRTIDGGNLATRFEQHLSSAAADRLRAAEDRSAARSDRSAAGEDRLRSAFDDLTGAYRRGAGMDVLARDFEDAARMGQPMVIGFLDVDGLKTVNDRYGHAAGDALLRRVAATLRTHLGDGGHVVRYGGDEFILCVRGLELRQVRDRVRAIESALHADGSGSVSCGIASATGAATVDQVIEEADKDLYRRRRAARGVVANDSRLDEDHHPGRGVLHVADEHDRYMANVADRRVEAILDDLESVRPLFQPIVDLSDGSVVGYEALARWPSYPVVDPTDVFSAAATRGRLAELDWACRAAALDAAIGAGLTHGHALFLNVEPDTAHGFPEHAHAHIRAAADRMDIVLELTERSLLSDPATLLALVDRARRDGCRIALDDVGCHPDSLTLLEFIAPDVIKLDRLLVQDDPTPERAQTIAAISAHAESKGAEILAEGIENEDHLDRSRAYGATMGQGWMFGRPAPLPVTADLPTPLRASTRRPRREIIGLPDGEVPALPSDVFDCALPTIGRKSLVLALTRQIEQCAATMDGPLTILAAFQNIRWFAPAIARRYARLAADNPFVAALGIDMPSEPAPGVRGTNLHSDELFTQQWTITVVGQHYFAAVIARDLGDTGADEDRRFEFLHTHNRELVVAAARSLMQRVVPSITPQR